MWPVPTVTPVAMPEALPTVIREVLLLVHVPPDAALVRLMLPPVQTAFIPWLVSGMLFTETPAV